MTLFDPSLIFTLRALTPETVESAYEKLANAGVKPEVADYETDGVFDCYLVQSGSRFYAVDVFGWFAKCECHDFKYKGPCKHIAVCLPRVCIKCFSRSVAVQGEKCSKCDAENAPYLKQTFDRPLESFGGIRV